MTDETRNARSPGSSDERLAMGAKLGRYISIWPLLHTSVISSSISIILLGAMIKTKPQQPHASTDVAPTMGGLWSAAGHLETMKKRLRMLEVKSALKPWC
jgi:hypothetical protein